MISLALAFPLGACDDTPTAVQDDGVAPAFAVFDNDRFPFDATDIEVCGELVDFSGEFHIVTSLTTTKSGNLHTTFHINAKGTGIGQTSGTTYQWNDNIIEVVNEGTLPLTITALNTWRLIGRGHAGNFVLKQRFHVTVNANGEVTALHDTFEVTCR
jgi:hypothetical protein